MGFVTSPPSNPIGRKINFLNGYSSPSSGINILEYDVEVCNKEKTYSFNVVGTSLQIGVSTIPLNAINGRDNGGNVHGLFLISNGTSEALFLSDQLEPSFPTGYDFYVFLGPVRVEDVTTATPVFKSIGGICNDKWSYVSDLNIDSGANFVTAGTINYSFTFNDYIVPAHRILVSRLETHTILNSSSTPSADTTASVIIESDNTVFNLGARNVYQSSWATPIASAIFGNGTMVLDGFLISSSFTATISGTANPKVSIFNKALRFGQP